MRAGEDHYSMRSIFAAAAGLFVATSALACPEPEGERHVITSEPPYDAKPDEVVLKVSVPHDVANQGFDRWQTIRVKVVEVLQGMYTGESIVLENGWISPTVRITTSCSRLGVESGYVAGRLGVDTTGHPVLFTRPRKLARFERGYAR
jgi:hypothetical protein